MRVSRQSLLRLALVVAVLLPVLWLASSHSPFSSASSMSAAREYHTATLLQDGRVLIVGGFDGESSLASAELSHPDRQPRL
jgi:hypothetical protein